MEYGYKLYQKSSFNQEYIYLFYKVIVNARYQVQYGIYLPSSDFLYKHLKKKIEKWERGKYIPYCTRFQVS